VVQLAVAWPPVTFFISFVLSFLACLICFNIIADRFVLQKRPKTLLVNKKYAFFNGLRLPTAGLSFEAIPPKSHGPHGHYPANEPGAAADIIAATGGAAGAFRVAAHELFERFLCQPLANGNLFCHFKRSFYVSKMAKNFGQQNGQRFTKRIKRWKGY
jgi:hypothetical protein